VLPLWVKLCVLAGIVASLASALWRHAWLKSTDAITAIDIDEQDAIVYRNDGRVDRAGILGTTYVSPLVTVLNLRVAGRMLPQHVIIVPDNVEREDFRRIRVWLRWGYHDS
jgi:toxin CptA